MLYGCGPGNDASIASDIINSLSFGQAFRHMERLALACSQKADSIVQLTQVRVTVILFFCPWGPNALTEKDIAGKVQKENGFIKGLKMSVVFVVTIGVC